MCFLVHWCLDAAGVTTWVVGINCHCRRRGQVVESIVRQGVRATGNLMAGRIRVTGLVVTVAQFPVATGTTRVGRPELHSYTT